MERLESQKISLLVYRNLFLREVTSQSTMGIVKDSVNDTGKISNPYGEKEIISYTNNNEFQWFKDSIVEKL